MRQIPVCIALLAVAAATAQNSPQPVPGAWTREDLERLERQIRQWQMENENSAWRNQILERQAAAQRRREFVEKANRLAALWKKVMGRYSETGVFNIRDARELSKAFRALEAAGWPK